MNKEEILENISDNDLEFAIKEIKELEEKKGTIRDTIMLYEIYSSLDEINAFDNEIVDLQLCAWCTKEYSYRKAGLK